MDRRESGPASLAMVLAQLGSFPTMHQLRTLCGVGREGSTIADLERAGRSLGLDVDTTEVTDGASATLEPPVILTTHNNNFMVYEGPRRRFGRVAHWVNDPARGRRRLTSAELSAEFSGTAMTFTPTSEFRPVGRPSRPMRELLGRLAGARGTVMAGIVISVLMAVLGTVEISFTKGFIDTFLTNAYSRPAVAFFTAMGATLLLIAILVVMQQRYVIRANTWLASERGGGYFWHVLQLPVAFFHQRRAADVAQRLRLNESVTRVLTRTTTLVVTSAGVVFAYVLLLFHLDPVLATIGLAGSLMNVGLARLVVRLRSDGVASSRLARNRLMSTAFGGIQQMETLKATSGEHEFFRRWGGDQAALLHDQQRIGGAPLLVGALASLLTTTTTVSVLLVGGVAAMNGRPTVGVLIAFLAVLPNLARPIGEITGTAQVVQDASADHAMLRDVESAEPQTGFDRPVTTSSRRLGGHIRVHELTFGYPGPPTPLIKSLSFEVGPGRQVAIVGGSGSGKSTVARLLAGLYEPWSGDIEFDGHAPSSIPRGVMAASAAFVDQDIFLFRGTVRENVTLGDPSITDDAVERALRDACLDEVIQRRPGGLSASVAQDGRNFSGGQRQRLEIARALVRDPAILVLDEATSALDARTEEQIGVNLRRRGCACVVIAHRLSTVRDSDEILVLDAGHVVERGRHAELLTGGGAYASMIREGSDGR